MPSTDTCVVFYVEKLSIVNVEYQHQREKDAVNNVGDKVIQHARVVLLKLLGVFIWHWTDKYLIGRGVL